MNLALLGAVATLASGSALLALTVAPSHADPAINSAPLYHVRADSSSVSPVDAGGGGPEGPCGGATPYPGAVPNGSVTLTPTATSGQVNVTYVLTGAEPNTTYITARTCVAYMASFTTDASGNGTVSFVDNVNSGDTVIYDVGRPNLTPNDAYLTPPFTYQGPPQTKADCKNGGFQLVPGADGTSFDNQGRCVSYVNHTG